MLWSLPEGGGALAFDAAGNLVSDGLATVTVPVDWPDYLPLPPPPSRGATPPPCFPNSATVQSVAYLQDFLAADGSLIGGQFLTGTDQLSAALTVEPDGRIVLAGNTTLADVPLSPGVLFDSRASIRNVSGTYLTAVDYRRPRRWPA